MAAARLQINLCGAPSTLAKSRELVYVVHNTEEHVEGWERVRKLTPAHPSCAAQRSLQTKRFLGSCPAIGTSTFPLPRSGITFFLEQAFPPVLDRLFETECSGQRNLSTLLDFDETAPNVCWVETQLVS